MPNHSSISNSKPRRLLAAWGISLTLVVVIETTLALLPENALVTTFHADGLPPRSPTWQIMGDSVARGGILATQLSATLPAGQLVFNLATPASGPEFPYFQLQREIAGGKAPLAIIYAPSPHTFASERVPLLVGGYCTWPEVVEVARAGIEPMDVLYGVLCKLSYTLRHREEIVGWLKGRRSIEADEASASPAGSPARSTSPRYTPENLNATYKRRFTVWHFNDYFFQKFLHLAETRHIPVYWVTMPVMPAVYESRKRQDFERDYFSWLDGLQKQKRIQILQREFLVWDEANFKDQTHLTPEAARHFTELIGEELKSLSQTP